jgi:AcrR family transcriptional regulator
MSEPLYSILDPADNGAGRHRDQRIDAALIAATADLLVQRSYSNVTVAEIVRRAGTTLSALYRRWSTKAELVHEAAFPDTKSQLPPSAEDIGIDIRAMIAVISDVCSSDVARAALPGLIADAAGDVSLHRRMITRFTDRFAPLRNRIDEARSRGEVHPGVEQDRLVEIIGGVVLWRVLFNPGERIDSEWLDGITAIILNGITDGPTQLTLPAATLAHSILR